MKRSYTSAKPETDAVSTTFDLDGREFTCAGAPSIMDLSEFARLAAQGVDSESPQGMAILAEVFLSLLGDQEYQRFRAQCRRNRTDGETLMAIMIDLVEELSERPTSRPSSSPDGPPNTPGTARVVSLSRGTVTEVNAQDTRSEATPAVVSYG